MSTLSLWLDWVSEGREGASQQGCCHNITKRSLRIDGLVRGTRGSDQDVYSGLSNQEGELTKVESVCDETLPSGPAWEQEALKKSQYRDVDMAHALCNQ